MTPFKGQAGQLWRQLSAYQLDPAEVMLLRLACQTLTESERIDAELAELPVLVSGSKGQAVPNPLLAEQRDHRRLFAHLIHEMALPVLGEQAGSHRTPAQRRKAKAKQGVGLEAVPGGSGTA